MSRGLTIGYGQVPLTLQAAKGLITVEGPAAALTSTGSGTVAIPTLSPAPGGYTGTQTITLTCSTPGSSIYYTVDGSTPTFPITGTTQLYTGTFAVTSTSTVKAIGVVSGLTTSAVASGTYTISAGGLVFVGGIAQTLSNATIGSFYTPSPILASGGTGSYTFTKLTDNTTCTWPVINTDGSFGSCWPLAVESQTITVQLTDGVTTIVGTFTIPTVSRTGFVPNISSSTMKTLANGTANVTAYNALNVPAMAAGTSFTDPVTGLTTTKLSDATHPSSNTGFCSEYSTLGLQISQAWGGSLNNYTIFILNVVGGGVLFDYTLGGTCSNYRAAPAGEGDVAFSRLPGEAQILYYTTSTKLNRYNTATNALANTGSYPYTWATAGGSGGNWLQFNRKHTWATSITTNNGSTINDFTALKIGTDSGVTDGHTQNAVTGVNSNEGYSGYNDISFIEGTGSNDYVWNMDTNVVTNVTYSASFSTQFHSPTMPGYTPWFETNQGGGVEPIHRITDAGAFSTPVQGSWYFGSIHTSGHWTQSQAASQQWGLMSTWFPTNPSSNTAALKFNNAFVDMNSGAIFIVNGHYSFGDNSTAGYRPQPHTTISDDGLIMIFSSQMQVVSGRVDAFLIEVPKH